MIGDNTCRFLGLAADHCVRGKEQPAENFGAVILSVVAVEHHVNWAPEFIEILIRDRDGELGLQNRTDGFQSLKEMNDNWRIGIKKRIVKLCSLIEGKDPDEESDVFKDLYCAIHIRNELIHRKPMVSVSGSRPCDSHPEWVKRIRDIGVLTENELAWLSPDQIGEENKIAVWVWRSVIAFFDHLGAIGSEYHAVTGQFRLGPEDRNAEGFDLRRDIYRKVKMKLPPTQ